MGIVTVKDRTYIFTEKIVLNWMISTQDDKGGEINAVRTCAQPVIYVKFGKILSAREGVSHYLTFYAATSSGTVSQ